VQRSGLHPDRYLGNLRRQSQSKDARLNPGSTSGSVLRLNLEDYVEVMSLMEEALLPDGGYRGPDNWWHSTDI